MRGGLFERLLQAHLRQLVFGSLFIEQTIEAQPPSTPAMAVDGNGATHLIDFFWSTEQLQPTLMDSIFPQGGITTRSEVQGIVIDAPQQGNEVPPPDPLNWDFPTKWTAGTVTGSVTVGARQTQICAGMIVRSSGEIDFAFYNFPYSQIVFFWLPLGANFWDNNLVGSVPVLL